MAPRSFATANDTTFVEETLHPFGGFSASPIEPNVTHLQTPSQSSVLHDVVNLADALDLRDRQDSQVWERLDGLSDQEDEIIAEAQDLRDHDDQLALLRSLAYLTNAYVFGVKEDVKTGIPKWLALSYVAMCEALQCDPAQSHTTTVILNWQATDFAASDGRWRDLRLHELPYEQLSVINQTFSRKFRVGKSEETFYQATAWVELALGRIPLLAWRFYSDRDPDKMKAAQELLQELRSGLEISAERMKALINGCHPHDFYEYIRPLFANSGSTSGGIDFGSREATQRYAHLEGASSIQSPTFWLMDVILGVEERKVASQASTHKKYTRHLLGKHRRTVDAFRRCEEENSLRAYIDSLPQDERGQLVELYNSAIRALAMWREAHFERFIKPCILHFSKHGQGTGALGALSEWMEKQKTLTLSCTLEL